VPIEELISISVETRTGERGLCKLRSLNWSDEERRNRALKAGLIGFGLTVGFVFLPIIHFVLVPLSLIVTPFVVRKIFRQKTFIPGQEMACPKCQQNFGLPGMMEMNECEFICDHCRSLVVLRPVKNV